MGVQKDWEVVQAGLNTAVDDVWDLAPALLLGLKRDVAASVVMTAVRRGDMSGIERMFERECESEAGAHDISAPNDSDPGRITIERVRKSREELLAGEYVGLDDLVEEKSDETFHVRRDEEQYEKLMEACQPLLMCLRAIFHASLSANQSLKVI